MRNRSAGGSNRVGTIVISASLLFAVGCASPGCSTCDLHEPYLMYLTDYQSFLPQPSWLNDGCRFSLSPKVDKFDEPIYRLNTGEGAAGKFLNLWYLPCTAHPVGKPANPEGKDSIHSVPIKALNWLPESVIRIRSVDQAIEYVRFCAEMAHRGWVPEEKAQWIRLLAIWPEDRPEGFYQDVREEGHLYRTGLWLPSTVANRLGMDPATAEKEGEGYRVTFWSLSPESDMDIAAQGPVAAVRWSMNVSRKGAISDAQPGRTIRMPADVADRLRSSG